MDLSHIDDKGNARMVDVTDKAPTIRRATAEGRIFMRPETVRAIENGEVTKGNVLNTAKVAAILAAKNTAGLIPMCHTLPIDFVEVDFTVERESVLITATAGVTAKTGVEMEALTAVSVAALTIYDMVKAIDKGMEIGGITLVSKSGGKSGDYCRGKKITE